MWLVGNQKIRKYLNDRKKLSKHSYIRSRNNFCSDLCNSSAGFHLNKEMED